MNFILLHGAPASGKYTVGRELAARTGYEFYHNHVVVDEALRHYPFGSPGFIAWRDRAWRDHFTRAAREQPPGIIFTFNPESTVPQAFLDWLFGDLPRLGVRIFSIGLVANEELIEARLGSDSRREYRKLTDLALYRRLRVEGAFATPLIPRTDLLVDTGTHSPPEAAVLVAGFIAV
jgi:hypothetical protein